MDYAGKLIGIIPPPPSKTNIRFVPYLLHVSSQESGTLVGNSSRNQFVMGGEIKWVITPTSILDFTFNTDFAQADVDKQVNNVSRFSVFFPERRQFFLENASLFSSGLTQVSGVLGGSMAIQPFFSRTIGLSKQVQPIPIVAGTRYVYRSEKRNFGGIFMRQGEGDGDPYTHFSVARYSENFGKQNRFGTIWTNKQSPSNSQTTGAIDGFIRFDDVLSLSTMATFSHDVSLAQTGFSEFSQIFYRSNNINAYWTQTVVSSQYNPSMGFVSRNNIASNSQGFAYNIRKKWFPSWIRGIEPGVYSEIYHNLTTGVAVEKKLLFSPFWIYLQNGGYIGTYLDGSIQNLDDNFSPLGIRILKGNYEYLRKGIMLSSDPSAKYFGSINYEWGNFYDGNLNFVQFKTRFAPIPNINFALTFERNFVDRLGAKQESKNVDLAIFETRLAINPRIQLIGFYQKNSSNDRNAINMRIAWEYQPLSYVYLVFNQTNYLGSDLNNQIEKQFLTKLSYLKQF